MMDRYLVTMLPNQTRWVILDRHLDGYCTLKTNDPEGENLLPLEWSTREAATAWLKQCQRAWEAERVPPPSNWKPRLPAPSPWAAGRQYTPSPWS